MPGFLATLIGDYKSQLERHRNRPFLRATMAACSLVANADGEVTFSERIRVDQIIDTLEELKVFDPHEAVDLFNEFNEEIQRSSKEGREKAIEAVETMAGDVERAELLIRICLAIGEAQGKPSLVDQIEIVTLCNLLGVDPKDRGLYTDRNARDLISG